MSKFVAEFEFGTGADRESVEAWFISIMDAMPADTTGTLRNEPLVLDLKEVSEVHAGNLVKFYNPRQKATVEGVLEHVFQSAKDEEARTLIVDGKAYELSYASVQLGEW